jgi:hypothetical protein
VASRIFWAHCVTVGTETERLLLALLATRNIVRLVLRSTNSARTSPIFSVLCHPMGFWRVGALFALSGHTSFFLPTS